MASAYEQLPLHPASPPTEFRLRAAHTNYLMKNLILGIALVGLAVGCKNNDTNQVSDASTVEAPEGACGDCSTDMCDEAAKADCAGKAKAGCDGDGAKVCPMSGKVEN